MGRKNVASGNDVVAVQVGQVTGRRESKAPKPAPAPETGPSGSTNIRSGNARVGLQVDELSGPIVIRM